MLLALMSRLRRYVGFRSFVAKPFPKSLQRGCAPRNPLL